MSKFSLEVLERYVHPFIQNNDPDVILGSVFGEDVAITRVHEGVLVSHVDPIVGAVKDIGWLAVHVACNDIATSGTPPRWILVLVLVPRREDEHLLEEIMRDASRAAAELGVTIIGGHSGYSSNLARPLVAVTALGTITDLQPVQTRGARLGDHVLITKGVALEGTAILANDFSDTAIELGLNQADLEAARQLMKSVSIVPEALILAKHGATSMHDVTRGGLLETLLEMAKLSQVKILVEEGQISLSPIVERFAKAFDFNPLKMISSGTLAATVPPGQVEAASEQLRQAGISFSDIGQIVAGEGVQINHGETMRLYHDIHCEEDELARIWELYPR
ncbi:hydrogenase expression/formation protein HypE [Ornatilinea apprima]|uniref:Hydrogenase expression/formation protein HypE n=1 Tax=Ornatilinea apprima TaxID=1134406 RepID=A0A0P6Y5P8_9CHLR|nr:AIR synthase family protein [Ornatilinea apprima]KPL76931.1 hydrogenase expression/formation protein HypE [Ornatilinea apprima]